MKYKNMFSAFNHFSIQGKIIGVILLNSVIVLLITFISFTTYNYLYMKKSLLKEVTLISNITANRLDSSLSFKQKNSAKNDVEALKSKSAVLLACVYEKSGALFTHYESTEAPHQCPRQISHVRKNNLLEVITPIGKSGILYLLSDQRDVNAQLQRYIIATTILFCLVIAIAYFSAAKFQKLISTPIKKLTNITKEITANHNYDISIDKGYDDELGSLASSFNVMLEEIHNSHTELKKANWHLDSQVRKRTKELEDTLKSLQEALEAKTNFLNNMSHELRTPNHHLYNLSRMNVEKIVMLQQQMEQDIANGRCEQSMKGYLKLMEKIKESGEFLQEASERETRLISNINDFSALAEKSMDFHIAKNDLDRFFFERVEARKRYENILRYESAGEPIYALFDWNQLLRLMEHILSNATAYAKDSEVVITVQRTVYKDPKGDRVEGIECCVADQGKGIPEAEMELVFETFWESSVTKNAAGGRGLGLTLCREIMTAHDGLIWISSNTPKGIVVHFTLPALPLEPVSKSG